MYRIGVDIGGTNVAVGVVNEAHKIIFNATTPTRTDIGAEGLVDDIVLCIHNAVILGGLRMADCTGIGIGSPGNCDTENGIVRNAHNLNWDGVPVCAMLQERTGLPARVGNDADCAALGEVVAGAAKGSRSALLITLGTGVGGGFVINGKIYSGHRTLGGEFGHMCIQMDGEPCSCGECGCWEAYASATALIRQAAAAAKEHPESVLNRTSLDGRAIYTAAAEGDAAAQAVVAKYAEYVGVGLVNLINALYPETVLLGGGVSGAGEALLTPLRTYVREHFFVADPALMPEIKAAELGNDAGILGAAALIDCPL